MAMARPVVAVAAPLLLLLLLLCAAVSGASGARATVGGGGDGVQEACSKTQFPKICAESLAAKPESQKACPRKLAELFVTIAADKGKAMATFVQGKYSGLSKKKEAEAAPLIGCYDSCSDDVEEAVAHLNGLVREPTDAKFLEVKSWLSSTLGGTSICEDTCKDAPKGADKDAVVNFSLDFEKLQRVTLDLITEASGSMSAGIALPPSDAAAAPSYGASAPYGGGASGSAEGPSAGGDDSGSGSGASSEGPAAAAGGPSSGGADAPSKSYGSSAASGPAADAPAGGAASGPSDASAPAPASSAGSSGGGAPAPSSDDGGPPARRRRRPATTTATIPTTGQPER